MSFTIPNQALFNNLADGELVVQLDSSEFVAVRAVGSVAPNGNSTIDAYARVIQADGSPAVDAAGNVIPQATYGTTLDTANLEMHGGIDNFRRMMVLTVLGEPAAWPHERHADILEHASIRTNLAAAAHAGPVNDLSILLV